MIAYVGYGRRDLPDVPSVYRRTHHELLVLITGRCAVITTGQDPSWRRSYLWLLPRGSCHGWRGDGRPCRLLSVMLPALGEPLAERVRTREGLGVALPTATRQRFDDLGERLFAAKDDYWALCHLEQVVLGELGLLLSPRDADTVPPHWRVEHALTWFEEHMHEAPDHERIANAVGCSAAHLRRLFRAAGLAPLGRRLDERRLARAKSMLSEGQWRTDYIARRCGWRTAGALTHAMHRLHGCSVRAWLARRRDLVPTLAR